MTILLNAPASAQAGAPGNQAPTFAKLPAAANVAYPTQSNGSGSIGPATIVLVVAILGLVFIGLVAVAGFTVMAQRRMRALGMLSALGATERDVQLVMVANGAAVGVVATLIGAAIGFGAWFAAGRTRAARHREAAAGVNRELAE